MLALNSCSAVQFNVGREQALQSTSSQCPYQQLSSQALLVPTTHAVRPPDLLLRPNENHTSVEQPLLMHLRLALALIERDADFARPKDVRSDGR